MGILLIVSHQNCIVNVNLIIIKSNIYIKVTELLDFVCDLHLLFLCGIDCHGKSKFIRNWIRLNYCYYLY
jgi:hypothetical protein